MKLYLASTSPRRKKILRQLGLNFTSLRSDFIEPALTLSHQPRKFAVSCALIKALSALRKKGLKPGLVIGVDTIVVLDKRILGKPANRCDARSMLRMLSGKTHQVISGVAVIRIPDRKIFTGAECTSVTFRPITTDEINRYINTTEPFDKAGAYAIQGQGGIFVEKIHGCYLNVVGLPVKMLLELLHRAGWSKNSG